MKDEFLSVANLEFKLPSSTGVIISADGWYPVPGSGKISLELAEKYDKEVRVLWEKRMKIQTFLNEAEFKICEANASYSRKINMIQGIILVLLFLFFTFILSYYGCVYNKGVVVPYGSYIEPIKIEKRVDMIQYWKFDKDYNLDVGYYYEFKGANDRGVWKWYDNGVMVWEY